MTLFEEIADEVLKGNSVPVEELTHKALSKNISAQKYIRRGNHE
jgi:methanogenic corrinoid protein MtbC1